jgi:hypothetical protein
MSTEVQDIRPGEMLSLALGISPNTTGVCSGSIPILTNQASSAFAISLASEDLSLTVERQVAARKEIKI